MMRNRPKLNGALIGLAVTLVCLAYFHLLDPGSVVVDSGRKLELQAFDIRMRHCNDLQPSTPIVHVDIDDGSLKEIGRWPWRRSELAGLVGALGDLGAKCIVIDLLFSEYERPLTDDPRYGPDSDVELNPPMLGEISEENVVFGDLELAEAIRAAGNVYLAVQFEVAGPDEPDSFPIRLRNEWDPVRHVTPSDVIDDFHLEDTHEERASIRKEILRLRMRNELLLDFTLTDEALCEVLHYDLIEVSAVLAGVKADVANELVAKLFRDGEIPTLDTVLASVLGDAREKNNADSQDVKAAFRRNRGLAAVRNATHHLGPDMQQHFHRASNAVPPHFYLADAAHGVGVVNFSHDIDAGVRRVPLVVSYEGRAVLQLGFAAACYILKLDAARMSVSEDHVLTVPSVQGGEPYEVPLDQDGNLIIHWTETAKDWRQGSDFPHIPAAKVLSIVNKRQEIENNERAVNLLYAEVIGVTRGEYELRHGDTEDSAEMTRVRHEGPFRQKINDQLALKRRIRLLRLRPDLLDDEIPELEKQSAQLLEEIRREQHNAVSTVEITCQEMKEVTPEELAADPELRETVRQYRWAEELITTKIAALHKANVRLEEAIEKLKADLAVKIKDKYVFLGFAATATGDIVTTPIDPRTNGVMCHAHVLNSFLQRRFVSPPVPWIDITLCLVLGAIASAITAVRGPKFAIAAILGLMLAYSLVNAYRLFQHSHWWVALAGTLVTIAATWAVVTLFRQLTAERERRFFAKQLSQYTSPAIAARIAESPEAAQAFKTVQTREVTCFFSDLKGFTTITEQENAEVVQYVLNTYLERMCQAIWSQRGLINKFMGDGIMAFFNPSVDPLTDHPLVAAETTLITLDELEKLKADEKEGAASPIFDKLHMRVGIATGQCKNGDFGSELKADYTVIGDVVNLAARLEPANKVFGTQIMVSGPTRERVKDLYEFRYLAELQVKGKAQTVPAYELVCRKGELADKQREYIERFEAGVALYKQKKWNECIVHFTRLLARKFDDIGASRYIDACQEFKAFPPDDDWNGALELKEK